MERVDVKGGQLTFGQRIELGRIVTDASLSEFEKFAGCMKCLNPEWRHSDTPKSIDYWGEVLDGLQYWVDREAKELKYTPTEEEREAGVEKMSLLVGEMGTIMALAKDYGKDPDEILDWKYGKVFNILFTNLQSYLYQDRLHKAHEKRIKNGSRYGGAR